MNKQFDETQSSFLFRFDGDNEIEARNLSKSIDLLANTFSLIADCYNPDSYMKMKVFAISPGSFIIDFDLLIGATATLISEIGVNNAQTIISIFIDIFKTKLFLNGKEPSLCEESEDNYILKNCDGATINVNKTTYNIYANNPKIDENISTISEIAQSENKTGIEIKSDTSDVSCNSKDFDTLKEVIYKECLPDKFMSNTVFVDLLLRSPDLLGHSKWGFYFTKNIHATIEDDAFIKKVLARKITSLYAGVKIPVEMEIITPLDSSGLPIENKEKYIIKKVTGKILEPDSTDENQITYLK